MNASAAHGFADIADRVPVAEAGPGDARGVRWIKREAETLVWAEWDAERGCRVVVKLYRRRGALSYARMRLGRFRAEREFLALKHLEQHGIPCTPPLGWSQGHSAAQGFHEALVTRELVGMRNLEDWLAEQNGGSSAPPDLSALPELLRRMHASGCYHGVLKPSNVLISAAPGKEPSFALMDMDMARVIGHDLYGTWVGRLDLLEMSSYLWKRFGDGALRHWLPSYGLDPAQIEGFLRELAVYALLSRQRRRNVRRRVHLAALAPALTGLARQRA